MLPGYIIEELLRIERERRPSRELYIERPEILDLPYEPPTERDDDEQGDRGGVIIDYTV